MITSTVAVSSATIEIQALEDHYFQGKYRVKDWFLKKILIVHVIGYLEEMNMPRSAMRGSTVVWTVNLMLEMFDRKANNSVSVG